MLNLAGVLDDKAVVLRKRLVEVWPAFRALAVSAEESDDLRSAPLRAALSNPTVPEVRDLRSVLRLTSDV